MWGLGGLGLGLGVYFCVCFCCCLFKVLCGKRILLRFCVLLYVLLGFLVYFAVVLFLNVLGS